jgi:hypothetical protein
MQDLSNKNIVVTDAACVISASLAGIAAMRGASVFCLDIDACSGAATAQQHGATFTHVMSASRLRGSRLRKPSMLNSMVSTTYMGTQAFKVPLRPRR